MHHQREATCNKVVIMTHTDVITPVFAASNEAAPNIVALGQVWLEAQIEGIIVGTKDAINIQFVTTPRDCDKQNHQ